MDGVVYLSHHSKNELSLNEPLKIPWHLMNHGICFRSAGADACFMPACGAFCLRNDEELMGMLILGAVLVLLAAGCLSVRQRLAAARENVRSAMGRTCLRMASGFDALEGLLDRIADSPTVEQRCSRSSLCGRRSRRKGGGTDVGAKCASVVRDVGFDA